MLRRFIAPTLILASTCLFVSPAGAQTLNERIANLKPKAETTDSGKPSVARRLAASIDHATISAPARKAFEWWSKVSEVPLVINWESLAAHGIDPDKTIAIDLHDLPASVVLTLLMQQATTEQDPLLYEATPWFIQVMTKSEANKNNVVRIYVISDLIADIPNFDTAPSFNLTAAIGNSSTGSTAGGTSGSSGSTGGSGPFSSAAPSTNANARPEAERVKQLTDLIRQVIEPDVWDTRGGAATITYLQGKLIVSAPPYVQRQIGIPSVSTRPLYAGAIIRPPASAKSNTAAGGNGVSGVSKTPAESPSSH